MIPREFTEFIPYSVFLQRMRLMAVPKGFSTLLVFHESTQICVELNQCGMTTTKLDRDSLMALGGRLIDKALFEMVQKQTATAIEYGTWLDRQSGYQNGIVMTNVRGFLFRMRANLSPQAASLFATKELPHYIDDELPETTLYIETPSWVIAHREDVSFTFPNPNTMELRLLMGINRMHDDASFTLQGVNHVG